MGRLEDGRTLFVPRTAPGDLVSLSRLHEHARFARARIGELLEAGPDRVAPRCAHYQADDCGGCQLQHLSLAAQRTAKRQIVADALTRIGRLDLPVPELIPAEPAWGYRARITLAVGPGRRRAGFHPVDEPHRVFGLVRCEVAAEPLNALWAALARQLHLLPADATHLVLRLDRKGGAHVVVRAKATDAWSRGPQLAEALARAGAPAAVWWEPEKGAPRVMGGGIETFPATVFEQVHPAMGDRIREFAVTALGEVAGAHLWDLYAGMGDATDAMAARGATVESVELDRRAVAWAERRGPAAPAVTRHAGRAEDLVARLRAPAAVLVNPPRAGMDPRVTDALIGRRPGRIAYVSCDPATLARDLGRLAIGGYRAVAVQPFDLFPHTAHVETVAVLEAV